MGDVMGRFAFPLWTVVLAAGDAAALAREAT